jgi:hypothetical protein
LKPLLGAVGSKKGEIDAGLKRRVELSGPLRINAKGMKSFKRGYIGKKQETQSGTKPT